MRVGPTVRFGRKKDASLERAKRFEDRVSASAEQDIVRVDEQDDAIGVVSVLF